jgi:hypothetical protein
MECCAVLMMFDVGRWRDGLMKMIDWFDVMMIVIALHVVLTLFAGLMALLIG